MTMAVQLAMVEDCLFVDVALDLIARCHDTIVNRATGLKLSGYAERPPLGSPTSAKMLRFISKAGRLIVHP
jgi:hypothetical protein